MKKYDPQIHHRHSIRMKDYDYSRAGLYFITICVKDRECLFGNIMDGKMILSDTGSMIEKWYLKLENNYTDIECGEFIVMPNHFHCIIINNGIPVGADPRVCPKTHNEPKNNNEPSILGEQPILDESLILGEQPILGEHMGSPLRSVVQWFKTMSTNEYIRGVKNNGWQSFNGKLWQRNYWEHIIRDGKSNQKISDYIINNPINWHNDILFI